MAPVEVTPITEVKRLLARGDAASAIRLGFPRAVEDATRAYAIAPRPDQTNLEFLRTAMAPGTRLVSQLELFERAYRLYEPLRFGTATARSDDFLAALTSIYAAPEMQRLYASPTRPPSVARTEAWMGEG